MPSTAGSGLKDLIDEARRRHEDTRPEMLRALVKLYVQEPEHGPAEQARFATLARRLFDSVDIPVAAKYVRQIAARADLPRQLMLHLARSPLAIAGPVLRLSPALSDDDLVELARSAPPDHRAAIGARRDVSPDLAKRLAALIDEKPATATPASAAEAADVSADMAVDVPEVDASAPADAAPTALEAGDAPPEAPRPETVAIEADAADAALLPATPQPPAPPAAESAPALPSPDEPSPKNVAEASPDFGFFAAGPEERTALIVRLITLPPLPLAERVGAPAGDAFTDALLDAAKADDKDRITSLMAEALDLAPAAARRIVMDETGQALAIAARVLGLSLAILSRMLFRLHPATGRSAPEMTRLAEMFDSLPVASAQHLVAQWRGARRAGRERADGAPPIRSYGVARPAPLGASDVAENRQRG